MGENLPSVKLEVSNEELRQQLVVEEMFTYIL